MEDYLQCNGVIRETVFFYILETDKIACFDNNQSGRISGFQ